MNTQHLLLLLASLWLGGCQFLPLKVVEPAEPSPVQVLQEQVQSERASRAAAEQAVVEESKNRRRWELAAVGFSMLACAGFVLGTILGSRGRRHAEKVTL